jgi:hypothetical protein
MAAMAGAEAVDPPPPGDVATRRANARAMFEAVAVGRPAVAGVEVDEYSLTTTDGAELPPPAARCCTYTVAA